ncbi:hypothetical protein [Pantoea ananatis]|uniref:hypothetical protein n=1 Tax=Pantoea ananas TaxID=553 RepID=UPI0023AEFC91|nr:hypothetical protein [Pantoea ananatis]
MSEIDFEAIGRCEHLKTEISRAIQSRHSAYSRLTTAYKGDGSGHVYNSITEIDTEKMQKALDELKNYEASVHELVREYNLWAAKASKQTLNFTKF